MCYTSLLYQNIICCNRFNGEMINSCLSENSLSVCCTVGKDVLLLSSDLQGTSSICWRDSSVG